MLYILCGDDYKKRGEKLSGLISFFLTKKPDTSVLIINPEIFSRYDLQELSFSQGIFEKKYIVVLSGLLEDKETKEVFLEKIPTISGSENIFIVNEREISSSTMKKIEGAAEKIQNFSTTNKSTKPDFNIFSLADAVGRRDKRASWTILLKAFKNFEPEEIHGTIFWQVKSMLLSKNATSAEAIGLKPFVFSKSKKYSGNYSEEELRNFSSRLLALYHDSHRGLSDFSLGLEKLILETI